MRWTFKRKVLELGKFEKAFIRTSREERMKHLHIFGRAAAMTLRIASQNIRDLGSFQSSWTYRASDIPQEQVDVMNTSKHAPFVEYGRRPGKPPPVGAVRGWAIRHLGSANAAYPLAKAIGKRGIRPRPIMTSPVMQDRLQKEWSEMMKQYWWSAVKKAAKK